LTSLQLNEYKKVPPHLAYVATLPCETLMSAKRANNDKLQGSVATYIRCSGVVNNQIKTCLLLSLRVIFKSVNIWQSYKLECGCLMHFARMANTLLTDEESARDNHILACNFAKYSPIKNLLTDSAIKLSVKSFISKARPRRVA